ncbi:MAG: glycoside hydrolase family 3 C-terminal domain-containing protein, partial [Verrucomicrobia bacterium]|nr:glycoside hydrolase family 3 C-terminal domain-containing protein [Verrucomicrobiota bacterium]
MIHCRSTSISSADTRVPTAGKHFLAYSMPLSGHDRSQVMIPDRYLREYFLPPFWNAMEKAHLKSLMVNSGEINGIPVHASYPILTRLLRDQMAFDGVLVSDWADIEKLHTVHRVAPDMREAVRMAIDAGIDMAMVPLDYQFTDHLVAMVKEGIILEERLDESVRRILRLKQELGLFENPYPAESALTVFGTEEAAALSLKAARQSLVLLKNDNVLPVAADTTILLTGPGCTSLPALHGAWSYTWQGADPAAYPQHLPDLLTAFNEAHGRDNVLYASVTTYDTVLDLDRAVRAAQRADLIVCVLAEKPATEQPGDINDLALPAAQTELVKALSFGKPLVVILLESRPRLITEIDSLANAVIFASHPGPFGGAALHDLLTGAINPSGKLPFTYPRDPHAILPYDH